MKFFLSLFHVQKLVVLGRSSYHATTAGHANRLPKVEYFVFYWRIYIVLK